MKQIEQQNKRVSPSPQKGAITERGLFRLMLPSLLGILLCSTCLAGLTWAYFSDSVTSSANTITAATFTVEVTITEITEAETGGEGSSTDPVGAGSAGTLMNGSLASGAGGQEENTPSGTSSANASNTAANAEGNTLTANVLSVGTTDPSTEIQPNEEVGTDTGPGTQQGVTITGKDSTSAAGTSEGGSVSQNEAAGEGSTTGKDSTSAAGTPEAGSVPKNEAAGEGSTTGEDSTSKEGTSEGGSVSQIEAAGEVTFAAANSSKTGSETDTTVKRNEDGSYSLTLAAGKKYTVKLTASGTTRGYCKVTVNGTDYYTVKMDPAQVLDFDIDCLGMTSETTVTITPRWVNSDYSNIESEAATNKINNGTTIGTPTTDDNTTEQILNEEAVRPNKQITVEPTPVEPTPVEPTPAEQTPAEQTPSEETTNAGEPTGTTSEEQSEE